MNRLVSGYFYNGGVYFTGTGPVLLSDALSSL
jgi:hypothetical protein